MKTTDWILAFVIVFAAVLAANLVALKIASEQLTAAASNSKLSPWLNLLGSA